MRKSGDKTRKKILDTALKIFAHKGFLAARVSDISKQAGTAHGLLYYYFRDKEDILQAIFEENWKELTKNVQGVIDHHGGTVQKIEAIISYVFHVFHNHPDLFRVIVINLRYTPEISQSIRIGLLKDFLNPLYTLFKKGQREGTFIKTIDPEVAIQLLFGMVENSIRSILIGV
ncbi:MAG: TetR/AcrR family transcriptional regulator, partial [Candidatus Delongbacteria bacterium]|nr:TetR/AcrR family transcriptional regulator [Candidatus Delongbacteria bacterium]